MLRHSILVSCLFAVTLSAAEHSNRRLAGVQSLDIYRDGERIHRLTGEAGSETEQAKLFHAQSTDGGATWSAPVRVDAGSPPPFGLRRGMDAQIAAAGNHLAAVWTTAGTDKWGSGPLVTSISDDGGKTWRPGRNPADDGSTTGHGFIDIAADEKGAFHLTWLDGRDGRQGLRYSRSADAGKTWSPNATLKAGTCECCANAFAVGAGGGLAILFRDQSPRDMALIRSADGGATWGAPTAAGSFRWEFNGCPHVGGAIAFGPGKSCALHAAVWTGSQEMVGVHYVRSTDGGTTWAQPRRIAGPTSSHPDLATDSASRLAIVWDQHDGVSASVWAATSQDGGVEWQVPKRLSGPAVNASQPRVVAVGTGFRVFWTEEHGDKPLAVASEALR